MHRRHLLLSALAALAAPVYAAPQRYVLGPDGATIAYTFRLNGTPVTGTVPVHQANLRIDPGNLAASTADVTADIRRARTGLLFATQALISPDVLDAQRHPLARFTSTRVVLGRRSKVT